MSSNAMQLFFILSLLVLFLSHLIDDADSKRIGKPCITYNYTIAIANFHGIKIIRARRMTVNLCCMCIERVMFGLSTAITN